jgi:AraC family transcriptional regulator
MHADEFRENAKLARLSLPFGILKSLVDDPARSVDWRWTHDPRIAQPFLRLVTRAHRDGAHTFHADDADLLDLLAAFTARPARASGVPPRWLEEVMDELRSTWQPGLRVADIARRAGVHPVYLARCVRRWYARGVAEELRQLRLRAAATSIAQSRETVSRIAHHCGYADEPHLCREFHQTLGITPRRYRSIVGELS